MMKKKNKLDMKKKKIISEMKMVSLIMKGLRDDDLVRKYFQVQDLRALLEKLKKSKK